VGGFCSGELWLRLSGEWKARQAAAALKDLAWLGVTWEGVVSASETPNAEELREAAESWRKAGIAYPCACPFPADGLVAAPDELRGSEARTPSK